MGQPVDTVTSHPMMRSMVDDTPTVVVDCGAPEAYMDVDGVSMAISQPAEGFTPGEQPDVWIDPRPEASAVPMSTRASLMQETDIERLQADMGFSQHQILEALKRCSTVEGVIEWILSEDREWN